WPTHFRSTPALRWQRRRPGESAKAWEAARAYFELGTDRTLQKVAEIQGQSRAIPGPTETGRAGFRKSGLRSSLELWCSRYGWVERARAFDEYIETERQKTFEKAAAAAGQMWLDREM